MLRKTAEKLVDLAKEALHAFVPVIVLIVFTLIGALIFYVIEEPNERYELQQLKLEREKLIEETAFRLVQIKNRQGLSTYNETVRSLEEFRGGLGVKPVDPEAVKWNFWNSAYYAMTIYTTIGYGDLSPATTTGKIVTIIYAFIGIPIALITLVYLGSLFAKLVVFVWGLIIKTSGCLSKDLQEKMKKIGPSDSAVDCDDDEVLLQFPVSALIFYVTLYILIVAWIFTLWEDWDYGSSLYYSLISYLTIGFGDITPSTNDWTQCFTMFLILVGLAIVSTVLTIIQKQIQALASGMTGSIDEEYAKAIQEAEVDDASSSGSMRKSYSPEDKDKDQGKDVEKQATAKTSKSQPPNAIDNIRSRMPLKSQFLYSMMPEDRRKQLQKHAEKRMAITTRGTQTDAYLVTLHDVDNLLNEIEFQMSRKKTLSE